MAIKINSTPNRTLPEYPEAFRAAVSILKAIGAARSGKPYNIDIPATKAEIETALQKYPDEYLLIGALEVLTAYT